MNVLYRLRDQTELIACMRSEGRDFALLLLLQDVCRKKEDWFPMLIYSLVNSGHTPIAKEFHERFESKGRYNRK